MVDLDEGKVTSEMGFLGELENVPSARSFTCVILQGRHLRRTRVLSDNHRIGTQRGEVDEHGMKSHECVILQSQ